MKYELDHDQNYQVQDQNLKRALLTRYNNTIFFSY